MSFQQDYDYDYDSDNDVVMRDAPPYQAFRPSLRALTALDVPIPDQDDDWASAAAAVAAEADAAETKDLDQDADGWAAAVEDRKHDLLPIPNRATLQQYAEEADTCLREFLTKC